MGVSLFSAYQENPPATSFQNQEAGERILLLLREHPIVNLDWIVPALLGVAGPLLFWHFLPSSLLAQLIPAALQPLVITVYYLALLAWAVLSFLRWFFNVYLITDRRIVDLDYWGFLFFRLSTATLDHIEDVTYTVRGGGGVFFNYGDLFIQTAGAETHFDFSKVPQPAKVAHLLMTLIQRGEPVS